MESKSLEDLKRDSDDLNHLIIILKNGHYYQGAPDNSEQKISYELGQETRNKVLSMIEIIKDWKCN